MIEKTIYKPNLLPAYSYTVICGKFKKEFLATNKREIGAYVVNIWKNQLFPEPAFIYANITWDFDNILYCKYELKGDL